MNVRLTTTRSGHGYTASLNAVSDGRAVHLTEQYDGPRAKDRAGEAAAQWAADHGHVVTEVWDGGKPRGKS